MVSNKLFRIAALALVFALQAFSLPEAVSSVVAKPFHVREQASAGVHSAKLPEPVLIRFDSLTADRGLSLSITIPGDGDGVTTFSNHSFFSYKGPQTAKDVRIFAGGKLLFVTTGKAGWSVRHAPHAVLKVSYRLPPTDLTLIDAGVSEWVRPNIREGLFNLHGDTAWLLPIGRNRPDMIALSIDATAVADDQHFVSSFGSGAVQRVQAVSREKMGHAIFLGGAISLMVHDTGKGKIGIVLSAMAPTVRADDLRKDAIAIIESERKFFGEESQPWYLVSVHGGRRNNSKVNLGGGTGLTNSFAMFVTPDLDFGNAEQREQFRWVVAHEYFHQWNGLKLRVASLPHQNSDDTSLYWFSEGFTEFYAMRLLTRAGLQTPRRSLDVLDFKLKRYSNNSKRNLSAAAVGPLFYSDADADQIPYLRGYLAAWQVDIAMRRASNATRSLDDAMRALVERANKEPGFRVTNSFLVSYLVKGLPATDAESFRHFVIRGGASRLDIDSFAPCLEGELKTNQGQRTLHYEFSDIGKESCFRH